MNTQTSTRVDWNGGLVWLADRECRGFIDLALFFHSAQCLEYRYTAPCYRIVNKFHLHNSGKYFLGIVVALS